MSHQCFIRGMSFQLLFWHACQRNEWKALHSNISTPPTLSYIWLSSLSFLLSCRYCEWMQYVTERTGSYVPCVCDVSPLLRWERVPPDKLSVLSAGGGGGGGGSGVRGIAQCVHVCMCLCVCVSLDSPLTQNVLDYPSCISQQPIQIPTINAMQMQTPFNILAVSPSLVFICCLSNVIVREGE